MRSYPSVALDPIGAERCSCTTQYLPTDYPDSLPALGAMMRDREEQKRTYWCICCTHHHQRGSPSSPLKLGYKGAEEVVGGGNIN